MALLHIIAAIAACFIISAITGDTDENSRKQLIIIVFLAMIFSRLSEILEALSGK